MEDKEVEELLKKSAEKIDPGDFSVRYKAIKHKLKKKKRVKNGRFDLRIFIPVVSLSLVLVALIVLPVTITAKHRNEQPPTTYFVDDLGYDFVDEAEFYRELAKANYECADLSMANAGNYRLIVTLDHLVKGGAVEYADDSDTAERYISVNFYGKDVLLQTFNYDDYDLHYEVGGANIKYKLEYAVEDGVEGYSYKIYATYKDLTYIIDYVSLKNDVTDLFDFMFA